MVNAQIIEQDTQYNPNNATTLQNDTLINTRRRTFLLLDLSQKGFRLKSKGRLTLVKRWPSASLALRKCVTLSKKLRHSLPESDALFGSQDMKNPRFYPIFCAKHVKVVALLPHFQYLPPHHICPYTGHFRHHVVAW